MNRKLLIVPAVMAASALALSGCASGPTSAETRAASDTVKIVASTNVYGNIAETIGGDLISMTSIIDSPDKDPHEYRADAQNQLAISKADIVIFNGGGYDDFVDTMLSAAGDKGVTVLNAADISGYDQNPADGEFNEHVWYDFPTIGKLVDKLVAALSKADPDGAKTFQKNGGAFKAKLATLEATETDLKAEYAGDGVGITEPVPLYMLDAIGLDDKTPEKFSEAVEEDRDVAPSVLAKTLALFSNGAVELLVYNAQTMGPQTESVLKAAKKTAVPVVGVTETLPAGETYSSWMTENLDAISAALNR